MRPAEGLLCPGSPTAAVDQSLPGGLTWAEATALLRGLLAGPGAAGLSVTVFNPRLDPDGHLARRLVAYLHRALL